VTELPIGVGFGISTPGQAHDVAVFADAVVVGSAISQLIETHAKSDRLVDIVGEFAGALKDAIRSARHHGDAATA
jgi:tryptophan synthase alpha chain